MKERNNQEDFLLTVSWKKENNKACNKLRLLGGLESKCKNFLNCTDIEVQQEEIKTFFSLGEEERRICDY